MNHPAAQSGPPPPPFLQGVLEKILPGGRLLTVSDLPGSYSNFTHLIEAVDVAGEIQHFVLRRYKVFGDYDRGEKATREFKAYELLRRHEIPVPHPLYLDASGELLGIPGIVTIYVAGAHEESPADVAAWARHLAEVLAKIHTVPVSPADQNFLLDADAEASWFNRPDSIPAFMAAHPLGAAVRERFRARWPARKIAASGLVHLDYWAGNILWENGLISAVVDWEEAAYGDPAIDVAYCRMDMFLRGWPKAADAFLKRYEELTGRPVANLGLWELAAAARPIFSPEGWIDHSPFIERFETFVRNNLL